MPNILSEMTKGESNVAPQGLLYQPVDEDTYTQAMAYLVKCHIKYARFELREGQRANPAAIKRIAMENYDDGVREEFEAALDDAIQNGEFLELELV